MPGMAASSTIFEHWQLPEDRFVLHKLNWIIPEKDEALTTYAGRMCTLIEHEKIVLVGVSFGGVLVQEMARHIDVQKLIIVSSVKSKKELPRRMKLSRKLKLFKILPFRLVQDMDVLARYAFGKSIKNRVALYQKYLYVNHPSYLRWAVEEMVCWDQEYPQKGITHIHGDADRVFPAKYIKDYIHIAGGIHIMAVTKYKWFNENLPKLIEND